MNLFALLKKCNTNFTYHFLLFIIVGVLLEACGEQEIPYKKIEPAKVVADASSDFYKLQLTEKAVKRIGIETTQVTEEAMGQQRDKKELTVPYSSILYGAEGGTWVYTNPEPGNYIREAIKVDVIAGERVFLSEGPASGTRIVSQGAAELWGTEFHVGH